MSHSDTLRSFDGGRYLSLTTFRRDGTPVATPVWFVRDGDRLLVYTSKGTGKVKRIRSTGRVQLAPCNARGKIHGQTTEATARLLSDSDLPTIVRLMTTRYGWQYRLLRAGSSVMQRLGRGQGRIGIELTAGR